MTQTILKSVDFTKTQKSRYLQTKTFLKKSLITNQGLFYGKKKTFVKAVTFKILGNEEILGKSQKWF